MKKLILIGCLVGLLVGCKTTQTVPIHDSTVVENTETVTEDPTWTVPAEAYWNMLFECDSNRNVILSDYESMVYGMREDIKIEREKAQQEKDARSHAEKLLAKEKDYNRGLIVNISAFVDSNEIKNTIIEKLKNEKKVIEIPIEVPGPEVVRNSGFAHFAIWFFWIVLIAGVGFVVIKYKLWKVFFT